MSMEDRTIINQFVVTAVAEKVSAFETARFFTDRKTRADFNETVAFQDRTGLVVRREAYPTATLSEIRCNAEVTR